MSALPDITTEPDLRSGYREMHLDRLLAVASTSPADRARIFHRMRQDDDGVELIVDTFADSDARCVFLRCATAQSIRLKLNGPHRISVCAGGGWLVSPERAGHDAVFWIPQAPRLRRLDADGHILFHAPASLESVTANASELSVSLQAGDDAGIDIVAWRLPSSIASGLESLNAVELAPVFLWSSHTRYTRPADVFLHLVHGHVYENHEVWPKYWRVCSELDACALHVALSGLWRTTGKQIYALLRTQLVHSVIDRQAADGGWYHGEWTDRMESHYRLHAGGMLMLASHFEETRDPAAAAALEAACAFAAERTDRLDCGMWFLHDSLEQNEQTLHSYPFRVEKGNQLGKSRSNLLVLNTHVDTLVAMERARRVLGSERHSALIESAHGTLLAVCAMRPAEWLYRTIFRLIGLTLLPPDRGASLPLPLRALKRLSWKYLIPALPRIKSLFPRLVMPGGFIERDLAQHAFSVRYQPVNLMDLTRARRLFGAPALDPLLAESFAFTVDSGLKDRWKHLKGKEDDSLGFWAEALYHRCLDSDAPEARAMLAQAVIDLEDNGLGLAPSLLGGNGEAIPPARQMPTPVPQDARLRVVNLGDADRGGEWLVINPTGHPRPLSWAQPPAGDTLWQRGTDRGAETSARPLVPPRGWLHGRSART